ncbi:hypothetical protein CROQUDRAFT_88467 [Cronartium quercuum f. sp. fusiforme G11]|uniref:tRNA-guanine(15) transglycosylase-like domain-containing protein n=1 Tax=Cronartium quercuum f. sp. fusiforme G11 TaxID=708437 RepID=A0A9P6TGM1_9BASI|nr:hypothetical protein CROQUDRAFT_88467 [Cronartium quercuum f. sp. fusiforme G11]
MTIEVEPRLIFELKTDNKQTSPRIASLKLSSISLECPHLSVSTHLGSVPHLTHDLVQRHLPQLTAFHLHLQDFYTASDRPPPFTHAPCDLHRYIGLSTGSHLLSMGARPPPPAQTSLRPNTDYSITIQPQFGTMQLHIDDFIHSSLARPPDLLFAMADHPYHPNPGTNRLVKSLDRSFRWLSNLTRSAEGKTHVFAELVGSTNPILVEAFSRELQMRPLDPDQSTPTGPTTPLSKLADHLAGYVYPLSALRASLPFDSILPLICLAFTPLPLHKPRIIHGPRGPLEILHLIRSTGVDLFIDEWTSEISSVGIALAFEFPPSPHSPSNAPIGWNLYDERFAQDFDKLTLPASAPPTKAYIHHLLHTHEMSAHVYLSLHNHAAMSNFLGSVRETLKAGPEAFEEAVENFEKAYSVPDSLECAAREAWRVVKTARGKGRQK